MRLKVFLTVSALLLVAAAVAGSLWGRKSPVEQAARALVAGDYHRAADYTAERLKQDPTDEHALQIAVVAVKEIYSADYAFALCPDPATSPRYVPLTLACTDLLAGAMDMPIHAVIWLTLQLEHLPEHPALLARRLQLLLALEEYEAAKADLVILLGQADLERDPAGAVELVTLAATLLLREGDAAGAAEVLSLLNNRVPGNPTALLLEARAQAAIGETERAAQLEAQALVLQGAQVP